eukprot:31500-Amphidinium_carterae.1
MSFLSCAFCSGSVGERAALVSPCLGAHVRTGCSKAHFGQYGQNDTRTLNIAVIAWESQRQLDLCSSKIL